ncbi:hypothetical protein [Actinokineospora iranica]|uniref:Uncharacterized protein n=1 Tax=Actinokineospora iranica TaxID=1271860 RepID=A0A1G6T9A7_9PSEU|nr:hypothetical protein [Actinokineospora iranica]SDD25603.1 hypothetical protein SAMN05216174_10934 [Actinokineospora iranica]
MSDYFLLTPEVAGELGANSVVDRSVRPAVASKVEYAFHDWYGDELITATPVFLVTDGLAEELSRSGLSGFEFRDATITLAPEGEDMIGDISTLPPFKWLVVTGRGGHEDFGLVPPARLVVSAAAMDLLNTRRLPRCDAEPYERAGA